MNNKKLKSVSNNVKHFVCLLFSSSLHLKHDLKQRIVSVVSKADFGLSNVDNTSDAAKPISTAQQTALNLKVNTASVGVASGVASLDSGAKVPLAQIPNISVAGGQISDIQVVTPTAAQVLSYDGTKWTNTTASGGGNLAQTPVVVGVGEGTTNPQTVTIRGPAGTGTNVVPGDMIIQAPAGTGAWGSGKIRLQTAAKPMINLLYFHNGITVAALTNTLEICLPPIGTFSNLSLLIAVMNSPNATVSSITIPGISGITTLSSNTNATLGASVTIAYVQNVTTTGSKIVSVTKSVSSISSISVIVIDSGDVPTAPVTQAFTSATSSSASVSGAIEDDLVFDFIMYGKNTSATPIGSVPTNQKMIGNSATYSVSGPSPYSYYSMSLAPAPSSGSLTMSRSYSAAVSGTHFAFTVPCLRPASTSTPTFQDVLVIDGNGIMKTLPLPNLLPETRSLDAFAPQFLTPTSSRYQTFTASFSNGSNWRTVYLPRADQLQIGTTFYIKVTNVYCNVYICPVNTELSSTSTSSSLVGLAPASIIGNTTTSHNRLILTAGHWLYRFVKGDATDVGII